MHDEPRRMLRKLAGPLSGEVDVAVASQIEPLLLDVAVGTPGSSVVFDCAELSFIDSSGVNMLLRVAKRSGKPVQLVNLDPSCRRVFEYLGLCEQFGISEITRKRGTTGTGPGRAGRALD